MAAGSRGPAESDGAGLDATVGAAKGAATPVSTAFAKLCCPLAGAL
jgi:hypothetical protein